MLAILEIIFIWIILFCSSCAEKCVPPEFYMEAELSSCSGECCLYDSVIAEYELCDGRYVPEINECLWYIENIHIND